MSSNEICDSKRFKDVIMELSEEPINERDMNFGSSNLYCRGCTNIKPSNITEDIGPWETFASLRATTGSLRISKPEQLSTSIPNQRALHNRSKIDKSLETEPNFKLPRSAYETQLTKTDYNSQLESDETLLTLSAEFSEKRESKSPMEANIVILTIDSQVKSPLLHTSEASSIVETRILHQNPQGRNFSKPRKYFNLRSKEHQGSASSANLHRRTFSFPDTKDALMIRHQRERSNSPKDLKIKSTPNLFRNKPQKNKPYTVANSIAERVAIDDSKEDSTQSNQLCKLSSLLRESNSRQLKSPNLRKEELKANFKDLFSNECLSSPQKPIITEAKKEGASFLHHKRNYSVAPFLDAVAIPCDTSVAPSFSLHKAWRIKKSSVLLMK